MTPAPLRVLIVEHDAADAELNTAALQQGGFAPVVTIVATPAELTEALKGEPFDVVLADYRLPGWTGMDALPPIREAGHDTPLILVTGTLGDERAVDCVKRGAADYILKQNLGRLPAAVSRALAERDARRELDRAHERIRAAEAEARERADRFSQLANNISEVFYLMDADYRETHYINAAYERIWGRTCESLYADPQSFLEAVHADDRAHLVESIAEMRRGKDPGHVEFRIVRPDGQVRWITSHAVPVRDTQGNVHRISGVALDITDRWTARLALEDSEARFRKLVDAAFDAIVITQDGIVIEVNGGFVELFGYASETEVLGRPSRDFMASESIEEVERRVADEVEEAYEMVAVRKDGSRVHLAVTARSHDINGRPGRISALRDVTKQRTLEEQFRQAQKMEAVGRLAGGVAHDFNNLLTVISSYSEFIKADMGANDPRQSDLEEIMRASDAAASLTRQLLAFSRQEVIRPRHVALQDLLRSTDKMLRRLIGEDISLTTALGEDPLIVNVDPGHFEQVIMNLAVNARDAMPTGGQLTIETALAKLDDEYTADHWPATAGTFAMVAVSDTGIGMDEQTRNRIFEPFFTTKEVGKGTGLGLATVYGIVKQSGGFIWVYSEPGKGSTFKVYLPLVDVIAETPEERATAAVADRGTETVLLVEDAPAVRNSVRRILERVGYTVLEAPSAKAAIEIANRAAHIDVLLTDVVMPEMSGRELGEQFILIRPNAKILFMSGYTDDAVLRHGVLSSQVAFIQKPFTPERLAHKLRETLDARGGA